MVVDAENSVLPFFLTIDYISDRSNNQPTNSTNQPLVEAQGWAINEQGQVVLTAETTTVTPQTSWLPSPSGPNSQTGTQ